MSKYAVMVQVIYEVEASDPDRAQEIIQMGATYPVNVGFDVAPSISGESARVISEEIVEVENV